MVMNILYCSDNNYAPYLGVSMVSLLENNKSVQEINFYIVSDNISADNLRRLEDQVRSYGESRRVIIVDGKEWVNRLDDMKMIAYRGGHAANLRLFFTDYIEQDVERILYLDCDTIICSDLSELFETEMGNSPAAVVLDSLSAYYKKALDFEPQEGYFNSGVVLFDVKNWKEQNCQERIIETIRDVDRPLVNPDQDVLNLVLRDQKTVVSPKYNFQTTHKVYSNKSYFKVYLKDGYYTDEEIAKGSAAPVILHAYRFLGQFPWHKNAIHPWKELFWDYVKISEWKDLVPRENKGALFAIERIAFKLLPKTVFLFFFSKWQMYTFGKKIKESKKSREENKK